MQQDDDLLQEFVEEAKGHVEAVESGLVNIDIENIEAEAVNTIFRGVHSIKGSAGFFNLEKIVEISHVMENLLGEVRSGKIQLTAKMVDILLSATDSLKTMIDDVVSSESVDIGEHVQNIGEFLKSNTQGQISKNVKKTVKEQVKEQVKDTIKEPVKDQVVDLVDNSVKDSVKASIEDDSKRMSSNSNKSMDKIITEAIAQGHFYFKITALLDEDLLKNDINPLNIIKTLKSIGNFIQLKTYLREEWEELQEGSLDVFMEFYFTSVLEKRFLVDAVSLDEEFITEIDFETGKFDTEEFKIEKYDKAENEEASDDVETLEIEGIKLDDSKIEPKPEPKPEQLHNDKPKELATKQGHSIAVEDSIKVHITLLNDLLNLTSEMVLGRNQLLRAMENHKKGISGIDSILQNVDHITTQLQEKVMQTRMRPVSNVFNKFPRIIRELAKKLNKEIDLRLEGADVELDKSIIEAIGDPLTHLVRNSADHGLETPESRMEIGKPRVGNIIIKAYHEAGYVNIDVIDDGAGINIERIKSKAIEKGYATSNDISNMLESEVLQFLFKPGFSTAEVVTDVSGRGVGMDVVKTNIEKLGGTIEIFTASTKGTTFRLLLPLTLAIIPSLIVEAGGERFALPQVNLQEIVRIRPGDNSRNIERINNNDVLRLRGKLLPIVHLADVLGLKRSYLDNKSNEYKEEKRKTILGDYSEETEETEEIVPVKKRNIVNILRILVIKIGSRKLGVAVDTIHGGEEILVKPIPIFMKDSKCYSGVTIMGDGKIAMILDPEGIIQKTSLRFNEEISEKSGASLNDIPENSHEYQNLLLFKGSSEETMALDMSLIARVEEIRLNQIEKIGDMDYIKFRDDLLRVVWAEDFLPIWQDENQSKILHAKQSYDADKKLYVIIPKLVSHPIGILIEKVYDSVQSKIVLNNEDRKIRGLLGSTILNGKVVLLVNLYELLEIVDPINYETEKPSGSKNKRVLLVEDTPFFMKMEKNYLEEAGYQVLTAVHGKDALQLLEENIVDVVVSDINMPIMDGLELIKRIRADEKLNKIPVLALTSLIGDSQKQSGLEAGFDIYEFKLDRVKLLDGVKTLLELRR